MKIIADAFGGDNAPLEIIKGAAAAVEEYGIEVLLCGDEEKIRKCAAENGLSLKNMEILPAGDVISMHDDPMEIRRSKSDCSMAVGLRALAEGKGDAFISAGSTGALVVGSTFLVKRIRGVKRAAFGSQLPTVDGRHFFLMDEGANVACRPEMLLQYGIMASVYCENVLDMKNPRVGLLNIGTEDSKGGELQLEAYKLLSQSNLNFIGNVEARDLMNGVCDVVVTDGFTGNVLLKSIEGTASALMKMLKSVFKKGILSKLAALLVMPGLRSMKKTMDYKQIGGAPIIGVQKPVFKAHGNSDAEAFKSAIGLAVRSVKGGMIEKLTEHLKPQESGKPQEKAEKAEKAEETQEATKETAKEATE